ncbi:MAG TPA: isoprenylcysteine carboxylmethyltransferase family protein [Acidimicrobiales bacterium]|nr:isoprenylcysteine carboxylmethyltransferase family protein [Acidimicrobiales bacterium]
MQSSSNVVPNRSRRRATVRFLVPTVAGMLFIAFVVVALIGTHSLPGAPRSSAVETNAAAAGLFGILLLSEVWVLASRAKYSGEEQDRSTGLAIGLCLPAAFGGAVAVADTGFGPSIGGKPWFLLFLGVALALGGFALRLWAIVTLGSMFQQRLVIQDDHAIVTDGPYRLVRHPSYTGPILVFVGIGLVLGTWVGLLLSIVLPVAAYVWRISVEERMLVAGLGSTYERYRERTWRLVPGIW